MKAKDWTECTPKEMEKLAETMVKGMPSVSHYERIGDTVTVVFKAEASR